MKNHIELYINNQKVDLSDSTKVLFTYRIKDVPMLGALACLLAIFGALLSQIGRVNNKIIPIDN